MNNRPVRWKFATDDEEDADYSGQVRTELERLTDDYLRQPIATPQALAVLKVMVSKF